jgi:hypothetical protein
VNFTHLVEQDTDRCSFCPDAPWPRPHKPPGCPEKNIFFKYILSGPKATSNVTGNIKVVDVLSKFLALKIKFNAKVFFL